MENIFLAQCIIKIKIIIIFLLLYNEFFFNYYKSNQNTLYFHTWFKILLFGFIMIGYQYF